jgi:hypothetical protein
MRALQRFGAALLDLSEDDLAAADTVFQMGVAPRRIDVMTGITGVTFDQAWPSRVTVAIEGLSVPVIGRADLLRNKAASGRPKDLADMAALGTAQAAKRRSARKSDRGQRR